MDIEKVLQESGLSKGEVSVYLALLKLGSVPVSKIKEHTNIHRTTIYDFLEKLLNKGLVNYVIKNSVKYYAAGAPDKLLDFVKEKERGLLGILPSLKAISGVSGDELSVEVYKGTEGFKTVLNIVLKAGADAVGFGIDEKIFKKKFPILMEQYFLREEEAGIKERILTSEDAKYVFNKKNVTYRFIPKEFFNPTPTMVYDEMVMIIIWEPLTVILIKNSELAKSYRKHFEMLWSMAKKKPSA